MSALHLAVSGPQWRCDYPLRAQLLHEHTGAHDVRDSVQSSDFVEMHLVDGPTVHLGLRGSYRAVDL